MLIETRKFILPSHIVPKLHKDALLMSFENSWKIKKVYDEIIGINDVDHFSINVVDPTNQMSIISYSPSIVYNIFKDGTYIYNGSISPTYYKNLDFYAWDQCYDRRFYNETKRSLQIKNGIDTGVVIVHREFDFNIIFSFATKTKNSDLIFDISENNQKFMKMGFHCLNQIKDIYSKYYTSEKFHLIKEPSFIKTISGRPNLKLISNRT